MREGNKDALKAHVYPDFIPAGVNVTPSAPPSPFLYPDC